MENSFPTDQGLGWGTASGWLTRIAFMCTLFLLLLCHLCLRSSGVRSWGLGTPNLVSVVIVSSIFQSFISRISFLPFNWSFLKNSCSSCYECLFLQIFRGQEIVFLQKETVHYAYVFWVSVFIVYFDLFLWSCEFSSKTKWALISDSYLQLKNHIDQCRCVLCISFTVVELLSHSCYALKGKIDSIQR